MPVFEQRKKIDARMRQLKADADYWLPMWKDLSRWGNPMRGHFAGEDPKDARKINHKRILNNQFLRALRTSAAGLHSGLTSPSRPWFRLTVNDPELTRYSPVRLWLDDVEQRIYTVFNRSNIYKVLPMMYSELLLFGTAAAPIDENFESVINAKALTCGQYYLDVNEDGQVNTFGRRLDMTTAQLVSAFGHDNCPEEVQRAWREDKLSKTFVVNHLIEPNDDRIKGQRDFRNKAYRSVYWIDGRDKENVLRLSGYDEFPIIAPRWEITKTSDVYGTSPSMLAMGDQKTLQEMERRGLMGLAKMVDPPVNIPSSAASVNTMPGGINPFDPMVQGADAGARATYQVALPLDQLSQYIQRTENRIDEALFVDLFRMILDSNNVQPITAREVVERHEEKMMNLGPVLESMNQELHAPLINRTFNIMMRGGLIPDPPPDIAQQALKVDFISILAQAQQMVASTTIQQSLGFIGGVAGLFPEVVDVVDIDKTAREYMQANGMPESCMRSEDDVAQIRQQRQEAQQQQQMAQDMGNMVQGAKVLSDAKLDGNNALTALTGVGGSDVGTGV